MSPLPATSAQISFRIAASISLVLLSIDIAGRILLAVTGLYPTDTAKNTFSLIAGTMIVAFVAAYIGWKWKSFA